VTSINYRPRGVTPTLVVALHNSAVSAAEFIFTVRLDV